jgi:hypothetical protein
VSSARQRELAEQLEASGALDGILEQLDTGKVPLGGDDGLLKGILTAAPERGLRARHRQRNQDPMANKPDGDWFTAVE